MSLQRLLEVMKTHKRSDDILFPPEICVECFSPYPCATIADVLAGGTDAEG